MLELTCDVDRVVEDQYIAELLNIPAAHIRGIYFMQQMAFPDGHLVIRLHLYADRDLSEAKGKENALIEITDSGIRCYDLSSHATPRQKVFHSGNDWSSVPMGDDILYVQGTSHAFLVSRGVEPVIRDVVIERGIDDIRINENVSAVLRPGRNAHPVSEGYSAAIPLSHGSGNEHLAVLTLNPDTLQARWSSSVPKSEDERRRSFVSRLWRNSSTPAVNASPWLQLNPDDFPSIAPAQAFMPLVNEALIRKGRIHVYTKGHSDSPKYGHECSDIAELGPDGRVVSRPFAHDYTKTRDQKKYGINGRFTSSGRYCVLSSIYQSTDPWNGRQQLFDMDDSNLVEVAMPRGYAKFRIVDHAADFFWAELQEADKNGIRRLARLRVA